MAVAAGQACAVGEGERVEGREKKGHDAPSIAAAQHSAVTGQLVCSDGGEDHRRDQEAGEERSTGSPGARRKPLDALLGGAACCGGATFRVVGGGAAAACCDRRVEAIASTSCDSARETEAASISTVHVMRCAMASCSYTARAAEEEGLVGGEKERKAPEIKRTKRRRNYEGLATEEWSEWCSDRRACLSQAGAAAPLYSPSTNMGTF